MVKHDFTDLFRPEIFASLREKYQTSLTNVRHPDPFNKVFNLDIIDFLARFDDESVNLMVVDEDYSAADSGWNPAAKNENVSKFDWHVYDVPTHAVMPWAYHAERILKTDHGNLIVFGFPQWATLAAGVLQDARLHWRTHRVWIKTNSAPNRRPNAPNFPSHYECIWIASKGRYHMNLQEPRAMSNWVYDTVCEHCRASYPVYLSTEWDHPTWFKSVQEWDISEEPFPDFDGEPFMISLCPACNRKSRMWRPDQIDMGWLMKSFYAGPLTNDPGRQHPAKKPNWLIAELMTILSDEDDFVIDPMCGQGTTAVVASSLNRRFAVNDLDPKWAEFAQRAISLRHIK